MVEPDIQPHWYVVRCTAGGCAAPAAYKVASEWGEGTKSELKTYALSCPAHLDAAVARGVQSQARCRLSPGESISPLRIYELRPGVPDRELRRLPDLESQYLAP